MDGLVLTTELVPGGRWILEGLERLVGWARMSLKPEKSSGEILFLYFRNTNAHHLRETCQKSGKDL